MLRITESWYTVCTGLGKKPSGRLGQVDFELGQVTFHGHLPNEKAPSQNPLPTKYQHLF